MEDFEILISKCSKCHLMGDNYALPRIHKGNGKKIMFIGEAPGRTEAKYHLSFIGKSGHELDSWISYMDVDNYYITNIVKHRPFENDRDIPPTDEQIKSCKPYLTDEILIYQPDFIVLLGNSALKYFHITGGVTKIIPIYLVKEYLYSIANFDNKIMNSRIFALFHPSYVLRQYNMDENFDLKLVGYLDKLKILFHPNI